MLLPLRQQAAILTVMVFVPVLLVVGWVASTTYDEHLRELEDQTVATAAIVGEYVEASLLALDAVATAASFHPSVAALDPDGFADLLERLGAHLVISNVVLARADGSGARWAGPVADAVKAQLPASWLAEVAASSAPLISPVLEGAAEGEHTAVMGYPVLDTDGAPMAVLGLVLDLEALESVLASIPLPSGSVVTLSDKDSVVLARSHEADRFIGQTITEPAERRSISEVPRQAVLSGVDGIERAYGNHLISRGPWLVSVGIPTNVAWHRTWSIYRRNFIVLLSLAAVVLVIESLTVRRIVRAFEHLDRAADRVAHGDLSTPAAHPMPSAELGRLQRTFIGMVDHQREAAELVSSQVAEERRIRKELESLQRQVIRQERLAAIGVLVSGVAHELNNPLQAILGFSELLQMRKGLPADVEGDLRLIQAESARASAIIRNLSRFGRQQSGEPQEVRIGDLVASVVELRQRKIDEAGIDLVVDEQAHAPVHAVFTELQQVLLNLVINAEQALEVTSRSPRRIMIRTRDEGEHVWVEVEDTGGGVPASDEAKLFQPFFTTKSVGEGTGLGLSVSYGIIEAHGGHLGYRSAPGGGALFFFSLPIQASAPESNT